MLSSLPVDFTNPAFLLVTRRSFSPQHLPKPKRTKERKKKRQLRKSHQTRKKVTNPRIKHPRRNQPPKLLQRPVRFKRIVSLARFLFLAFYCYLFCSFSFFFFPITHWCLGLADALKFYLSEGIVLPYP